jgi:hypothetical protein
VYVPLTFSVAVPWFGNPGKLKVKRALAPGARFVTGEGANVNDPDPKVVPAIVTCSELTVTLPVFVTTTYGPP